MPNLFIDVEARFAKFQDSLDQVARKTTQSVGQIDKAFGALKGTLQTIGATLTVGAITAFIRNSIDAADHLDDLSKKTGIALETIGGLGFAAQQSGGNLDSMADAAGKLNRSIAEAGAGNKDKAEAFRLLGVSVKDAAGNLKSADVVMAELADKFAQYADGPNKVALAIRIFDKAGADIIPTLDEGGAKLQANIEYYRRYSAVTQDVADKAGEFNDTLVKLNLLSAALGTKISAALLGPLQAIADHMVEAKEKSELFEKSVSGLRVVFEALIVLGSEVSFVFETIGKDIARAVENVKLIAKGDFEGSRRLGELFKKDAADARKAHDDFIAGVLGSRKQLTAADLDDAAAGKVRVPRPKPQAPGLVDPGAAAQAEAARKAIDALTEARSKIAVDAEKNSATARLAVLDHFYKEGFAGEERYWQVRGDIQKSAYQIERKALDENVASRQKAADDALKSKGKGSKEYYDALKDLSEAQAKRNTLDAAFNAQGNADVLARAKATEDYKKAIENVNIQLLELQGNTAEATRRRLELQNELLLKEAQNRGDVEGQAAIARSQEAAEAQARFNELRDRATEITERLALEEERIQNSQRVGAISELEALERTDRARRIALQTLRLTQTQLDEIAASSGLDKLRLDADKFKVSLESLASSANLVGDKFSTIFEGAFLDSWQVFRDEIQKSGKVLDALGKAFTSFANKVASELEAIAAKNLARALFGGKEGESAGSGVLGEFFKKIFGGGASASASIGYGTIDPTQSGIVGSFAMGTDYVPRTGLALVHQGEQIIPAGERSRGDVTIQNVYNIDARSDRAEIVSMIKASEQRSVAQAADLSRRSNSYRRNMTGR